MTDLNCPYCDAEIEICHDDTCDDPSETYQHECHACGKTFVFEFEYQIVYSASRAPCLNGEGDHDWRELVSTSPIKAERCLTCDEERPVAGAAHELD